MASMTNTGVSNVTKNFSRAGTDILHDPSMRKAAKSKLAMLKVQHSCVKRGDHGTELNVVVIVAVNCMNVIIILICPNSVAPSPEPE